MSILSFVILTWNSETYLHRCFDSIIGCCARENIEFELIIVDNGSSDGSLAIFRHYSRALADRFNLIRLGSNQGTTYSRNLGLKLSRGKYICVLDSDTEILEGSLNRVLEFLNTRQDVGIVAPRLLLDNGTVQNSAKKFPTLWQKLMKIPGILLGIRIPHNDFYEDFPFAAQKEIDSAISACWFLSRELLQQVGLLDEKIFYSPEDLDYCLRVRYARKKIIYFPQLTVRHHTQQISHRSPFSRLSLSHFLGLIYYFKKHGGWFCRPELGTDSI